MSYKLEPISSYQAASGGGTWFRYYSMEDYLGSGETLTGTPEVTTTTTGVTLSEKAVNSTVIINKQKTVAIGKAVTFRVTATIHQEITALIIVSVETTGGNRKSVTLLQPIIITEE